MLSVSEYHFFLNSKLPSINFPQENLQLKWSFFKMFLLGSQSREKESRMVVANRPGREKPTKIEQRKVRGQEREPQVKQIALLAGPVYMGQAQRQKNIKRRAKASSISFSLSLFLSLSLSLSLPRTGALFSSRLWVNMPSRLEDGFSCSYLNKIDL